MKHRYKKVLIGCFVLIIILGLLILNRERLYSYIKKDDSEVVILGDISINYPTGNLIAFSCAEGKAEYSFSISNNGSSTNFFNIGLTDSDTNMKKDELKYMLTAEGEEAEMQSLTIDEVLYNGVVEAGETIRYRLVISYDGKEQDRYLNSKIYVALNGNKDTGFADIILSDNDVAELKTTPGDFTATQVEGLISEPDEYSTSYYFRGNVTNNYVYFAGYTWRIVRISGNNTIKLVLDTTVENSVKQFNTNEYVVESNYLSKGDFSDSLVLNSLKDWYDENLKKYDDYIANTKFCVHSASLVNENGYKYYLPYVRNQLEKSPAFTCETTSFNSKVGLLSVDEVIFAGATSLADNTSYYLYNSKITNSWWTLSPSYLVESTNDVYIYGVNINGRIDAALDSETSFALRPVISLNPSVKVTGKGTVDNPYTIVEDE